MNFHLRRRNKINANGREGLLVAIIKQPNTNLVTLSSAMAKKLEELIQPKNEMELKEVKFLLPEGSGKFVFNYPFASG